MTKKCRRCGESIKGSISIAMQPYYGSGDLRSVLLKEELSFVVHDLESLIHVKNGEYKGWCKVKSGPIYYLPVCAICETQWAKAMREWFADGKEDTEDIIEEIEDHWDHDFWKGVSICGMDDCWVREEWYIMEDVDGLWMPKYIAYILHRFGVSNLKENVIKYQSCAISNLCSSDGCCNPKHITIVGADSKEVLEKKE